ncbi:hypothetical protein F4778DRAFT_730211, partial [Xylariomycetidae sp. FL2044]
PPPPPPPCLSTSPLVPQPKGSKAKKDSSSRRSRSTGPQSAGYPPSRALHHFSPCHFVARRKQRGGRGERERKGGPPCAHLVKPSHVFSPARGFSDPYLVNVTWKWETKQKLDDNSIASGPIEIARHRPSIQGRPGNFSLEARFARRKKQSYSHTFFLLLHPVSRFCTPWDNPVAVPRAVSLGKVMMIMMIRSLLATPTHQPTAGRQAGRQTDRQPTECNR